MGDKQGFVLMEVLCSILIMSFCASVILFSITTSINQSAASMQQFRAMELAQGKMDEIADVDYASIVAENRTSFPPFDGDYQYDIDVDCGELLKNIRITVYYTDSISGMEKEVTLVGARAKR